jgi:hypothetical protein
MAWQFQALERLPTAFLLLRPVKTINRGGAVEALGKGGLLGLMLPIKFGTPACSRLEP